MTTIITSQAPDAKPIAVSRELTDQWEVIIEVPDFEVPEESFGGGRIIVPGVAEIISPLLVSNITDTTSTLSIRIYRQETETPFLVANEIMVPGRDVIAIPLNGQFILTGDRLEVKALDENQLTVTLSYTIGQAEQDDVI
jgi:hypothetical protein